MGWEGLQGSLEDQVEKRNYKGATMVMAVGWRRGQGFVRCVGDGY